MAASPGGNCQRCGSPLTAGAAFCPRCGTSVTAPQAVPTPVFLPPPPPPPPQAAVPPPPPQKSKLVLVIVIVVVVVVVIAILAIALFFFAVTTATAVDVTAVNITSSDNACGTNGQTAPGFVTGSGGSVQQTYTITNNNLFLSCTVNSVSATTSGFSISGANTPLTIPAGGTQSLSFTITAPSGRFNGVLTIDLE